MKDMQKSLGTDKETLTHVFRSLIVAVPGFGNSLERLLFRKDFDGTNQKIIFKKIDELAKLINHNKDYLDSSFGSINFHEYPLDLSVAKESLEELGDTLKDSRIELFSDISSRLDSDLTKEINPTSFSQLESDVVSGAANNKSITLSFVLPPFISHLHISLLKTALMFSLTGLKTSILLLDIPYGGLSIDRPSSWPNKTIALWKLSTFLQIMPKIFGFGQDVIENVKIVLQSNLYNSGYGYSDDFLKLRGNIILSDDVVNSIKNTAIYSKKPEGFLSYIENHLLDFYLSLSALNSHYILLGPDKLQLWKIFEHANADLKLNTTWYLVSKNIPSSTGSKISYDTDMCFVDKSFSSSRCTKEYTKWHVENIEGNRTYNYGQGYDKQIKAYYANLKNTLTSKAKKSNHILSAIKSLQSENIIGCYCFGGNASLSNQFILEQYRNLNNHIDWSGDVDLLFICDDKGQDEEIAGKIYNTLSQIGSVIFHPDFYSKRTTHYLPFEVVVLPKGSSYFSSKGILTGLSALTDGKLVNVFGPEVGNLIKIPDKKEYSLFEKRLSAYKTCHYGINHMLSELFTSVVQPKPYIDYERVIKFISADFYWLLTGEFNFDFDKQIYIYNLKKACEFADALENHIDFFSTEKNDNNLAKLAYKLCVIIQKYLALNSE